MKMKLFIIYMLVIVHCALKATSDIIQCYECENCDDIGGPQLITCPYEVTTAPLEKPNDTSSTAPNTSTTLNTTTSPNSSTTEDPGGSSEKPDSTSSSTAKSTEDNSTEHNETEENTTAEVDPEPTSASDKFALDGVNSTTHDRITSGVTNAESHNPSTSTPIPQPIRRPRPTSQGELRPGSSAMTQSNSSNFGNDGFGNNITQSDSVMDIQNDEPILATLGSTDSTVFLNPVSGSTTEGLHTSIPFEMNPTDSEFLTVGSLGSLPPRQSVTNDSDTSSTMLSLSEDVITESEESPSILEGLPSTADLIVKDDVSISDFSHPGKLELNTYSPNPPSFSVTPHLLDPSPTNTISKYPDSSINVEGLDEATTEETDIFGSKAPNLNKPHLLSQQPLADIRPVNLPPETSTNGETSVIPTKTPSTVIDLTSESLEYISPSTLDALETPFGIGSVDSSVPPIKKETSESSLTPLLPGSSTEFDEEGSFSNENEAFHPTRSNPIYSQTTDEFVEHRHVHRVVRSYRSFLKDGPTYQCYSLNTIDGEKKNLQKGCVKVPTDKDTCAVLQERYGKQIENCRVCDRDKCNSCTAVRNSLMLTLVIVSLGYFCK